MQVCRVGSFGAVLLGVGQSVIGCSGLAVRGLHLDGATTSESPTL